MDNDALAAAAMISQMGEKLSTKGLEKLNDWNWQDVSIISEMVPNEEGSLRKKTCATFSKTVGSDGHLVEAGTRFKYENNGKTYVIVITMCTVKKHLDENQRDVWSTSLSGELHITDE